MHPIGTEFTTVSPPDLTSTDWDESHLERVYTWRVIGYRRCARFMGDKDGKMLETIELVKWEYKR